MFRVVVYASPGYMDMRTVRYWLFQVTVAAKKAIKGTAIYCLGGGALVEVTRFCRDYSYNLFIRDTIGVEEMQRTISPDVLLAFCKGGEPVWSYATLATEKHVPVILTANMFTG